MAGVDVCCLVNSWAGVNLIGKDTYLKMKTLRSPEKKLVSFIPEGERKELSLLCCFQERVKASQTKLAIITDVYVVKGKATNLPGCEPSDKLVLITFIRKVDEVSYDQSGRQVRRQI